jgi:hypothetical protein
VLIFEFMSRQGEKNMGWYMSLVASVLERNENQFLQRNEIIQFNHEVYVTWCRPAKGPVKLGWIEHADGTLRAQHQHSDIANSVVYETNPVNEGVSPSVFSYAEQFDMGDPGTSMLFHLALPPLYMPKLESIEPFPTYARAEGNRIVMGWIRQPRTWFRFEFEQVSPKIFDSKAGILRRAVVNGQAKNLESEQDLESIDRRLRMWTENVQVLQQQAAEYGSLVPADLREEIKDAKTQVTELGKRKTIMLRPAPTAPKNNPWKSGMFYLLVFVVVAITCAAIGYFVSWYVLPIVLIATLLAVPIIGISQAFNDGTLSEKGYIKVIIESYKRLPLLNQSKKR